MFYSMKNFIAFSLCLIFQNEQTDYVQWNINATKKVVDTVVSVCASTLSYLFKKS